MKRFLYYFAMLAVILTAPALIGCERSGGDGDLDDVGDAIDRAGDRTGDAVEDAADNVRDAAR